MVTPSDRKASNSERTTVPVSGSIQQRHPLATSDISGHIERATSLQTATAPDLHDQKWLSSYTTHSMADTGAIEKLSKELLSRIYMYVFADNSFVRLKLHRPRNKEQLFV